MARKKTTAYSKVNFETLKNELSGVISYLNSEAVNDDLADSIDYKITKKGGVTPLIVSTIEKKIETQINSISSCSKILKALFDRESLSDFVRMGIDTLINKLDEIETYYLQRPLSSIDHRRITIPAGKNTITVNAASKEDQINARTRMLEKIFQIKPLISELESMKEEVITKGGYEVPESMMYDED